MVLSTRSTPIIAFARAPLAGAGPSEEPAPRKYRRSGSSMTIPPNRRRHRNRIVRAAGLLMLRASHRLSRIALQLYFRGIVTGPEAKLLLRGARSLRATAWNLCF